MVPKDLATDPFQHAFKVVHEPLFAKAIQEPEESKTQDVARTVGSKNLLHGEIAIQLAGLSYPLHARALKELQHSQMGLFTQTWYLLLSAHENRNVQDAPLKAWLFPGSRTKMLSRDTVQAHLVAQGFSELTGHYRKVDFEELAVNRGTAILMPWQKCDAISPSLCDRLCRLQAQEKDARINQRGPMWSDFHSEFRSYTKAHRGREQREMLWQKLSNMMR